MNQYVGIGFRKDFAEEMLNTTIMKPAFVEFAPENWMGIGGYWKKILHKVVDRFPVTCHGLSLSIGSPDDLDWDFLKNIKGFLEEYQVEIYSEHLSYSKCDNAHLYDLLPIPFRKEAVDHITSRVQQVQEFLGRRLALELVSYYTPVAAEMDELTFIQSIVKKSGCQLLLDVNNVYINSFNHHYDAKSFISGLPLDQVAYIHMAGHEKVSADLILDTHGEPIIDPVYELFDWTIQKMRPVPVLLERDFNIPQLEELQGEMNRLENICHQNWPKSYATAI